MTETETRQAINALKDAGLPALSATTANCLVRHCEKIRGDSITLPDFRVLYRLAARGLFDRDNET